MGDKSETVGLGGALFLMNGCLMSLWVDNTLLKMFYSYYCYSYYYKGYYSFFFWGWGRPLFLLSLVGVNSFIGFIGDRD